MLHNSWILKNRKFQRFLKFFCQSFAVFLDGLSKSSVCIGNILLRVVPRSWVSLPLDFRIHGNKKVTWVSGSPKYRDCVHYSESKNSWNNPVENSLCGFLERYLWLNPWELLFSKWQKNLNRLFYPSWSVFPRLLSIQTFNIAKYLYLINIILYISWCEKFFYFKSLSMLFAHPLSFPRFSGLSRQ